MTEALKQLLDRAIADIEHQPNRWDEYYLKKLRQFITQVDRLPDNDINYLYRSRVVGTLATTDTPAKEGIISRFMKRMQEQINIQHQNLYTPVLVGSQNIIKGEIVPEPSFESGSSSAAHINPGDNLAKRRMELEQLKQDMNNGIVTLEEYEDERQAIMNKYPLR